VRILRPRWLGLALLVVAALLAANELRPVGTVAADQTVSVALDSGGTNSQVPWPSGAQAAIGGPNGGAVVVTPGARPQPIASVAKVMTALVVLDARPLQKDETGPTLTVTADDVNEMQQLKSDGQSVVAVQAGEQLSELQALEALLIPSGNNIASLLARWSVGSVDAMVQRMNDRAKVLGLTHTTFNDVSGFSAKTVSTPGDLVALGQRAMLDPVIADVVSRPQVSLPVAGTAFNVNYALGQDGIVGIKTGNIPEGGAVYLFAAPGQVEGRAVTLVGAVQGLATLDLAFSGARALLRAARASFQEVHVVTRRQKVGRYAPPWGGGSDVLAGYDLDILTWPGTIVRLSLRTRAVNGDLAAGTKVGSLHVVAGDATFDVPVTTADALTAPTWPQRLTRVSW
jgi:serine-type D-Ala-D-Ala carboxypeptidase (penicillin-binding protein 5/6)